MKRNVLILASILVLFIFSISLAWANVTLLQSDLEDNLPTLNVCKAFSLVPTMSAASIGNGNSAAPGQDPTREDWLDNARFWELQFHRCVHRCEKDYHDDILRCRTQYESKIITKEQFDKCKDDALNKFFECRRKCKICLEFAEHSREQAKQATQNALPQKQ